MLHHKQKLLFHRKRKFLKFNFLVKFIFNDQTLSNIMYTCTQQDFLLGKKKIFEKNHDQNNEDSFMNFYFPSQSTTEIWKEVQVFLKNKQTTHTERIQGIPFYQDGLI